MNDISRARQENSAAERPDLPEGLLRAQHSPMNESVSGDGEQLATFHIAEASRALTAFTAPAAAFAVPVR